MHNLSIFTRLNQWTVGNVVLLAVAKGPKEPPAALSAYLSEALLPASVLHPRVTSTARKKRLPSRSRDKMTIMKKMKITPHEHERGATRNMMPTYPSMDEAVWQLDEAQDQLSERDSRQNAPTDAQVAGLADSFLIAHAQPPPYTSSAAQLPLPVVITQRRPESRTKGFVRAYSPLLEDVGIDQATFLDFLDNLNKSLAPSPWIQAINLAAFAGQAVPEPFTIMISIAVKKVADAASELHSRSKTNVFLDRVNKDFFAPRGLVALIMTWKPNQKDALLTTAEFDMQSSIAKASNSSKSRSRFESSSGATSFEWPQTAPLVFPALDELPGEKQAAIKRSGKFVGEYMDKRARAKWAGENPDSALANANGKESFSSRYADPNHPASSGDPIALLTGG